MKYIYSLALAAIISVPSFAGTTLSCVGPNLLLVETVGDSGMAVPGRNGTLFLKDQLVEKHVGNYGDIEMKWRDITVSRKRQAVLFPSTRNHNVTVTVTREALTVSRVDGQPLLSGEATSVTESVVCSDVSEFRPVP